MLAHLAAHRPAFGFVGPQPGGDVITRGLLGGGRMF